MEWNVIRLGSTTSTMDAALAHVRSASPAAAHGTVVVADTQTAGRGRHRRRWVSEAPGDLLATFILRVRASLVPSFPMLCGLAAARTVDDRIPQSASIKWPNDVLVDGRKVCGILAESWTDGVDTAVMLGFGINLVFAPPEGARLRSPVANLNEFASAAVSRDDALERLQSHVAELFERLDRGEPEVVLAEWARRLETLGKSVSVAYNADGDGGRATGDTVTGVAESVDATGRLLIRDGNGMLHAVSAGDVSTAD